jgi:hypothetical protein
MTPFEQLMKNLLGQLPWHKRWKIKIHAFVSTVIGHFFFPKKHKGEIQKIISSMPLNVQLLFAHHVKNNQGEKDVF